jgi:pimeloyl-ACP methyl ester carboxylesterase
MLSSKRRGRDSGSLLLPKTRTPSPAVVLVAGSGGRTRNAHEYSKDDIDGAREFVTEKMTVGRTGLGWDALQARMKTFEQNPPKWSSEFADPPGSLLSARYWWVAFFGYDPKADLARTYIPVLAVFGALDRIVPPKKALEAMRAALPPNKQHDFVELPDADHSMLAPVVVNGQKVCQLVLPEYLDRLHAWISRL